MGADDPRIRQAEKLEVAICIFLRERHGTLNFETDEDAIKYVMKFL